MRARSVLLVVALIAGWVCPASAQLSLRNAVDTTLVTVGDRIALTVQVTHPADASVAWPDSLNLEPFEVLGAQGAPDRTTDDGVVSSAVYFLAAFELGMLEIPSFEVPVLLGDGGRELLTTDRFVIEVATVGADEGGDIRGIRGPLSIPISVVTVGLWALLLALAAALGAWGYRRWVRSRADGEPSAPVEPARPAHEIALAALDRIEASDLLGRGEVKAYHIEVSETVRRYLEARFRVSALEMTTWEVVDGLRRVGAGEAFLDELRKVLDQCDLVKFAKARPDADRSRAVLEQARAVVRSSMQGARPSVDSTPAVGPASSSDPAPSADPASSGDSAPSGDPASSGDSTPSGDQAPSGPPKPVVAAAPAAAEPPEPEEA